MGDLLTFPHSAASRDSNPDKDANVTSEHPRSSASRTSSSHRAAGMPRVRQQLTVEGSKPRASARALVPPKTSMTSSGLKLIRDNIVCASQTCQGFSERKATFPWADDLIETMNERLKAQARRLQATRQACGCETQVEFYEAIGVTKGHWSAFENGLRPLTLDVAHKIKRRYRIPLDWSLDGDIQSLELAPAAIARLLTEFAA